MPPQLGQRFGSGNITKLVQLFFLANTFRKNSKLKNKKKLRIWRNSVFCGHRQVILSFVKSDYSHMLPLASLTFNLIYLISLYIVLNILMFNDMA